VNDALRKDPHKNTKKTVAAVFVGGIGLLALVVFLAFGSLLHEFLIFDANRTQAKRELSTLQDGISSAESLLKTHKAELAVQSEEVKECLQKLRDEIAGREAVIARQQAMADECAGLIAQITRAKTEYTNALSDLKEVQELTSRENGTRSALKIENAALLEQIAANKKMVVTGVKSNEELEKQAAQVRDQILAAERERAALAGQVEADKIATADYASRLSEESNHVSVVRQVYSRLKEDAASAQKTLDLISAQVTLAQETVKARAAEKAALELSIAELKGTQVALQEDLVRVQGALKSVKNSAALLEGARAGQSMKSATHQADVTGAGDAEKH
jgi:chromosome segregation ATPase